MKIAGMQKTSFVDYPGKLACVVFTPHCNMKCPYCHNKHILSGNIPLIDEEEVFAYLKKRQDVLGAVVVTGGEPTLQKDLAGFIKAVKELGYPVKLDTNGTNPAVIKSLFDNKLLDYVAMDVKAPLHKYYEAAGCPVNVNAIAESIRLLKASDIPHEFRTTFAPCLNEDDILAIGDLIKGCKNYYLQQYRQIPGEPEAHDGEYVLKTAEKMRDKIGVCQTRGLGTNL